MNKLLIISAFSMLFFQVILGLDLVYSVISVLADLPRFSIFMRIVFVYEMYIEGTSICKNAVLISVDDEYKERTK